MCSPLMGSRQTSNRRTKWNATTGQSAIRAVIPSNSPSRANDSNSKPRSRWNRLKAQQQAQQQGQAQQQATAEQVDNFKKAFSVCLEVKDYMVKF